MAALINPFGSAKGMTLAFSAKRIDATADARRLSFAICAWDRCGGGKFTV
jgi:hypothetical protein